MPDDPRTPSPRRTVDVDDPDAMEHPEHDPDIEAAWLVEAQRRLKDLEEGRVTPIPWEEARASIFAPPTPDELAAMSSRRARG